jgi:hypothetical protein
VRFARVGVIALVGFAIGILWPRLAGMQLVPSAPVQSEGAAEPEASAAPAAATSATPAGEEKGAAKTAKNPLDPADRVQVSEVLVTSCRDAEGRTLDKCDEIEWDSVATPRLKALAGCQGAQGAAGVLSLGVDLDFSTGKVDNVRSGKSTSIDSSIGKQLLGCAATEFATASLKGVAHQYEKYTVFFKVEFAPETREPEESAGSDEDAVEASGRATVGWQVALIRKEPRKGEVVARILSGTNVVVTGRQGDWYRVKYDGKGNEGWVYRSAIGL